MATPSRPPRGRRHPLPPRAHDRAGHDHRHGAHGAGTGRRRRAKCAAGPRRHRRAALATCATLLFVPVVFSLVHGSRVRTQSLDVDRSPSLRMEKHMPTDLGTPIALLHAPLEEGGLIAGGLAFVVIVARTGRPATWRARRSRTWTDDQAIPTVSVLRPSNLRGGNEPDFSRAR